MSKLKKRYVGKIGYCDNVDLGINKPKGHYVYIRKYYKNGTCDVNTITSLEDHKGNFLLSKIDHVRKGNTYSIPKYDSNFTRWSGVNKTPIKGIPITKIKNIGNRSFKKRHRFFIGKYLK